MNAAFRVLPELSFVSFRFTVGFFPVGKCRLISRVALVLVIYTSPDYCAVRPSIERSTVGSHRPIQFEDKLMVDGY